MSLTVEALAQEMILNESASCLRNAHERAAALLPFIERHIAAGQQGDIWREEAELLGMCIEQALEKMKEPADYLGQALREHKNYVLTDGKTHG